VHKWGPVVKHGPYGGFLFFSEVLAKAFTGLQPL